MNVSITGRNGPREVSSLVCEHGVAERKASVTRRATDSIRDVPRVVRHSRAR